MLEEENITKPWRYTEFLGFNNKVGKAHRPGGRIYAAQGLYASYSPICSTTGKTGRSADQVVFPTAIRLTYPG